MLKTVLERKLSYYYNDIIEEVCSYFGKDNEEKIRDMLKNVKVIIGDEDGQPVHTGFSYFYYGREPVCVKEDRVNSIIVPLEVACDRDGNVKFVHVLLHAIGEEIFNSYKYELFNETLVDYMAEDICKKLEDKKINITVSDKPLYCSTSCYSELFDIAGPFYEKNKKGIIEAKAGNGSCFDEEEIKHYNNLIKEKFEKVVLNDEYKRIEDVLNRQR